MVKVSEATSAHRKPKPITLSPRSTPMTLQLTVPSMACAACAETITQAIQAVDASATVEADPQTKRVAVETTAAEGAVKSAVEAAGYPVS
jgi:copper chaperone